MRLKNKVALITGAADGIGKATVEMFLSEGAKVIATDINFQGDTVVSANKITMYHDVSNEEDWEKVFKYSFDHFGEIDILVNNAGIGLKEGVIQTSTAQWDRVMMTNTKSVFLGIKTSIDYLNTKEGSSIINMSSIFGVIGTGGAAAYHSSKAALIGLTKTSAIELAEKKIRVNTIHPGIIITNMSKKRIANQTIREEAEKRTSLPYFGEPIDVAYGATFLGSDESKFITGTSLFIDGGYTSN